METSGVAGKAAKKITKQIRKPWAISVITVCLIFGAWILASVTNIASMKTVPPIQLVFKALVDICTEGYKGSTLLGHLGSSFYRLFIAFFLAVVTAIPVGLASGMSRKIRAALDPVIEFVRPLPPLAYYTVLVFWLGIDDESKIMLLFLACFTPIYVACVSAVSKIPNAYLDTARTLGAGRRAIFVKVILPYTTPDIFTGIRTAIGHGYSTLVAAEMVAAASGIGWMVHDASNWLRNDVIFAGIIVMGVTGIIIDRLLLFAEKKLVPWKGRQ